MLAVTYTTTVDDGLVLEMYSKVRSLTFWRRVAFDVAKRAVGVAIGIALLLWYNVRPEMFVGLVVVIILLAVVVYPAYLVRFYRREARARLMTWAAMFGPTSLTLTDDGLTLRSPVAEESARWETMKMVVAKRDYTYIFLTPAKAVLIPRRGFEREEDYAAVRDFALAKLPRMS